jgi:hypothetical protein
MSRFTTPLVLTVALLVGVSMVPSAIANEPYYVTVYNQTDDTVRACGGHDSVTLGPHSAHTLGVDVDVSYNGCVHADSVDGSNKHWDEPVRGPAVYLNP